MYSRPHHQRIQRVLESVNPDLLRRNQCLFGGGTAIALTHGEYRESVDVDMIVSSQGGYRELRGLVNSRAIEALLKRLQMTMLENSLRVLIQGLAVRVVGGGQG